MKKITKIKTKTRTKTRTKTKTVNHPAKAVENLNLILAKCRLLDCLDSQMERFLTLCSKLKITRIYWDYNGYGDSGDVENIELSTHNDEGFEVTLDHATLNPKTNKYEKSSSWTHEHDELLSLCRHHVFDNLISDAIGIDWYNDEGGFGEACFNSETGEVKINTSSYEKVVGDTESRELNLLNRLTE